MTQEELAERSELGVRTIRGLETGERGDPRVGTVEALADALGLTEAERVELLAAASRSARPRAAAAPCAGRADRLAEAAGLLAYELRARLRREEEQRQIHDPVPLPVRWRPAPATLIDSWANIRWPSRGSRRARSSLSASWTRSSRSTGGSRPAGWWCSAAPGPARRS